MAAATITKQRWTVDGARRTITYTITIPDSAHNQIFTPLHVIDFCDCTSTHNDDAGASASKGVVTVFNPDNPETNLLVKVIGL